MSDNCLASNFESIDTNYFECPGNVIEIVNSLDQTKVLNFNITGTTGTTTTIRSNSTASRVITLPDITDTIIGHNSSDTLTNKTISGLSNTFSSINANSIADGSISNTQFQTLSTLTGNIQTQLNSLAPNTAEYLLVSTNASLPNSKVIAATSDFNTTDGGANNNYSISLATLPITAGTYTNPDVTVNQKGIITSISNGIISGFGSYFEEVSNPNAGNTTSSVYQIHLTLITGIKPAGNYRIGFYYEWASNSTNNNFTARVQLDGSTIASQEKRNKDSGGSSNIPGSGTDQRITAGGFIDTFFSISQTHTITIGYAAIPGGSTSSIQNSRLEIWKIN